MSDELNYVTYGLTNSEGILLNPIRAIENDFATLEAVKESNGADFYYLLDLPQNDIIIGQTQFVDGVWI